MMTTTSAHRFTPWRATARGDSTSSRPHKNIPTRLLALQRQRDEARTSTKSEDEVKVIMPLVPTSFTKQKGGNDVALGNGYSLQPQDVLYGTVQQGLGRNSGRHSGNLRFRILAELRLDRYRDASGPAEKRRLAREVVNAVLESNGSFVKCEGTSWFRVCDQKAMEMAAMLLRCLSLSYGTNNDPFRRRSAPSSKTCAAAAALSLRRWSGSSQFSAALNPSSSSQVSPFAGNVRKPTSDNGFESVFESNETLPTDQAIKLV